MRHCSVTVLGLTVVITRSNRPFLTQPDHWCPEKLSPHPGQAQDNLQGGDLFCSEGTFPTETAIYSSLPWRSNQPGLNLTSWGDGSHLSSWSSFSPTQGTNNVLVSHDAWTASFSQPPPALGNTSLSPFPRLGLIPTARLQPDAYPFWQT